MIRGFETSTYPGLQNLFYLVCLVDLVVDNNRNFRRFKFTTNIPYLSSLTKRKH